MDMISATEALSALAQTTRLRVFRSLVKAGERGVPAGEIAADEDVPHNTMSTHLSTLLRADLVRSRREGRSIIYAANLNGIRALLSYLVSDCCDGHPEVCAPLLEIVQTACCPPPLRTRPRAAGSRTRKTAAKVHRTAKSAKA